jgi:8-oxo-dGTP pyrophosphatase MutT (NUDIX family)
LYTALAKLAGWVAPVTRGLTLGVRGACVDADGRVFMVKHSYMPGWYLPGGAVERHESVGEALARELREEGGIELHAEPELFGVYWNRKHRRDHVVIYICRAFYRPAPPRYPNREIMEIGFFDPLAPPADTSPGTARRLAEIFSGAPRAVDW